MDSQFISYGFEMIGRGTYKDPIVEVKVPKCALQAEIYSLKSPAQYRPPRQFYRGGGHFMTPPGLG